MSLKKAEDSKCNFFKQMLTKKKLGTANCFDKDVAKFNPIDQKGRDFTEKEWKVETTVLSFG